MTALRGAGDVAPFHAEGRDPVVIGFHGFTGTVSELRPLLERIASAGFAVRADLLPGHGTRPADLQALTFDDLVDGVRSRMPSDRRFVLLGFSLGSLLAMTLASESPSGLAGLVVLGNALRLSPASSLPLGALDRIGARPDRYLVKPFTVDMEDRKAARAITSYDRHPIRAAMEVYRAGPRVEELLSKVRCPTLVLHGKKDRVCPASNAERVVSHLGTRNVRVRIYARSGHVVAADYDREAVASDCIAFLTDVAQAPVEP